MARNEMAEIFTCYKCGYTGPSGWTDEEAEAEYEQLYGKHLGEEREVLCDKCHKLFQEWLSKNKGVLDQ